MADPNELRELKDALGRKLGTPETDFDGILQLASEISRQQDGVIRFQTDAAIIRRLGRELVAKQETALGELVKNAYDADATRCTVNLYRTPVATGFDIIDDGNGMTYAEIANGFMRLASDQKVVNPTSPKYERSRAGKKGIGRFATERLGRRLVIVTQTEHEPHAWTMEIDWDDFVQGADISLIQNSIAATKKEMPKGTRIGIQDLRDSWTDADLKRVFRYLATLIQPPLEGLVPTAAMPLPKPKEADPGFVVEITRGGSLIEDPRVVANADTEILGQALAEITATVDAAGQTTWGMVCPRFDIDIKSERVGLDKTGLAPLDHAHDVEMRAYYYILKPEFLGHSTSSIRDVLKERGGIRLYRNGYRVPPYGDPADDWLGLDEKRTSTYAPLRRNVFLGFIALQDPAGISFEETSAREGLIASDALQEVREVMSKVLEAAVTRIESTRGLGRKPRDRQDPTSGAKAAAEIEEAISDLRTALVADEANTGGNQQETRRTINASFQRLAATAKIAVQVAEERDEFLEEINLLRILASMGLTIAEFTHDFSHLAETMELNLNALEASVTDPPPQFAARMDRFRGQFRQVRAYSSHFGSMMTNNSVRELQSIDLYEFARNFREDLKAMFTKRGLELEVNRPDGYDMRTVPMHLSEWSSILLNLLTNSIKAAERAGRAGRFAIDIGRLDGGMVYLQFSDNGDGIPETNRDRIFDAFFTTGGGSPARSSEAVQAIGTGLGLKIVADIVSSAGGRIEIKDPLDGYTTSIRIIVPEAADEMETPE